MTKSLAPLTWFRSFEAAARHLSFTAAADETGVTQSAISQNVRALEQRLGVSLFVRQARGLALTDAGRRLLPYVASAMGELTKATQLFGSGFRQDSLITLATSISVAMGFLGPRLSGFYQQHPDIQLRIVTTLWPEDHRFSHADIEIRYGPPELVADGAMRLVTDHILPVCNPLDIPGIGSLDDLYNRPLIQAVGTSDSWDVWAKSLSLKSPKALALMVDSYALTLDFARLGFGVALTSGFLANDSILSGIVVNPLGLSAPAKDGFYLARRAGPKDALCDAFETWLREEISIMNPVGFSM